MYKTGKYYIILSRCGALDQFQKHEVRQLWGEIFLKECDLEHKRQQEDLCNILDAKLSPTSGGIATTSPSDV